MIHRRVVVLFFGIVFAPVGAAAPLFSGELGLAHDSNLNNGYGGGYDERSDQFAQLAAGVRQRWQPGDHVALDGGFRLHGEAYDRYSALSNLGATVSGRAIYRPGRRLLSPWFEAGVSAGYTDYDSALRDRAGYRLYAAIRQPLTTRINGRLQLSAQRDAARSEVFDTDSIGITGEVDWLLTEHLLVYFSQHLQRGDIVATTAPVVLPPYVAQTPDDAFDPGGGEIAYRVDGRTWITGLGVNRRLAQHLSADLLLRYADASADDGVAYSRLQGFLSVLVRY